MPASAQARDRNDPRIGRALRLAFLGTVARRSPPRCTRVIGSSLAGPAREGAKVKRVLLLTPTFLSAAAVIFLMTEHSSAQHGPDSSQCEQIRQAIAQYGYQAARRHALANYGREA